jgi:hypothetical protein
MALVDVEGVFYATILVGGTRQATAATKWAPIPACSGICQTADGGAELVCRLNLWRMELFKYMKVGQAAVPRCRHHTVATRRL